MALGRGPVPDGDFSRHQHHHPAAGWGAAESVAKVLEELGTPVEGVRALFVMNQERGGFDCPGCAWPDDPTGLHLDLCENGVKHVTWELTRQQAGREFLYQLWVREFGTNNLPDCSNMCHEASGRALTAALGTGKDTVDLTDWEKADAIWLMGDNAATNAPRMLTWLAEADRRGAALVHINPLIEAASRRTIVPHEFADMATFHTTRIGTMNVQVRIDGDMALLRGVAKAVFEAAVIIAWCLGVTQHEHGVDTCREIVNLLLLRGNIGREGAGPCPVRGHSNVQGNRTCGIDNRPDKRFLDRLVPELRADRARRDQA